MKKTIVRDHAVIYSLAALVCLFAIVFGVLHESKTERRYDRGQMGGQMQKAKSHGRNSTLASVSVGAPKATLSSFGINTYQSPLNMGVHTYCGLSFVNSAGSTNGECYVKYSATDSNSWTLSVADSVGNSNETVCQAICIDF